jgi:hypothetical protein
VRIVNGPLGARRRLNRRHRIVGATHQPHPTRKPRPTIPALP